jgi:alkylation response protein AidB-like acyl-CoA dehydrogenase
VIEEFSSSGLNDFLSGFGGGMIIGLPPVLVFGAPELRDRISQLVLSGEKRICLAITEPFAGSDVAKIKTTATLTSCGKFYLVNGIKKWITNAHFCDYFTTAVRTGGSGMDGISVLLVERGPGVRTKIIKTSGSSSSGTAYVFFENAKVPVANTLGKVNEGFKVIMFNFNQ